MRTLNRPMFNMGGPIKQGIMHGIREPYNSGGRMGFQIGGAINMAKWLATLGSRAGKTFGNVGGSYNLGKIGGGGSKFYPPAIIPKPSWGARIAEKWKGMPSWFKSSVERDPVFKLGKAGWEGKGMLGTPIKWTAKQLATPTGVIGGGLAIKAFWPDGTKKTKEELAAEGQHGPFDHSDKKKIKKAQAAFAEAQRDTRVQKYLDIMGYDRSKKTAVADALIDASKIVSDRGTLEGKNITRDLINPIIQATSKRFDKPEQIREAVGLMATKAEIEKDLNAETEALAKRLTMTKIRQGERALESGVAGKLLTYMAAKKGKVKGDELVDFVRLSANEEGKNFTMVTDDQVQAVPGWENKSAEEVISFIAKDDGVYMMGDTVIEVEGGKPTRIK